VVAGAAVVVVVREVADGTGEVEHAAASTAQAARADGTARRVRRGPKGRPPRSRGCGTRSTSLHPRGTGRRVRERAAISKVGPLTQERVTPTVFVHDRTPRHHGCLSIPDVEGRSVTGPLLVFLGQAVAVEVLPH
jgi:hypothetical protein